MPTPKARPLVRELVQVEHDLRVEHLLEGRRRLRVAREEVQVAVVGISFAAPACRRDGLGRR